MNAIAANFGESFSGHALRTEFLKWQCRARQIAMREKAGRPDDAVTPAVILSGEDTLFGHVITVLNKSPRFEVVAEMNHMAAKTNDPAQRREDAVRFFSASYYQQAREFSDVLTATFSPDSPGATTLRRTERCRLIFEAYGRRFELHCRIWRLAPKNPLRQATMAHNRLFNPNLPANTVVLGFEPDWANSTGGAPL